MTRGVAFTIASAPHEAEMTFLVKALGDRTKALHAECSRRNVIDSDNSLSVRIRGPCGAPTQYVGGYARVVSISRGVGCTPFSSICRDLYHHIERENTTPLLDSIQENDKIRLIEEELCKCINRHFTVNYGDPVLFHDQEDLSVVRTNLFHISDAISPRPAMTSPFIQLDYEKLFVNSNKETTSAPEMLSDETRRLGTRRHP